MQSIFPLAAILFAGTVLIALFILLKRAPNSSADAELQALRQENSALQKSLAVEQQKLVRLAELQKELEQKDLRIEDLRTDESALRQQLAKLEVTLDQERKQSAEKLALLTAARESMTKDFKLLADEVMKSHGETFSKQNRDQIDLVLKPLQQSLGAFQKNLTDAHIESVKERGILADQIQQLTRRSEEMTTETANLTRALKGEAQTQGAWGEMILSTILERSGLREGDEYLIQQSHSTEDGQRLRPDVIVNLPGGQRIVVDSKLSLVAFNDFVNSDSETDRAAHMKRHLASLRAHIRTLSGKEYHAATGSQLDYVIMFVPIEGALAAALQEDPGLTAEAVAANVAIATPTTLMIALRTAANVWQVERRNKNAEQIAQRAGKIYDKLVGYLEDMRMLGERLNQAQTSYGNAISKLSAGKGNLTSQVEQLKELGAKTGKSIPDQFLEDAGPNNDAEIAGTVNASPRVESAGG